jgi:hypothetical protein
MPEDFKTFFSTATGKPEPYAYQSRLACGEKASHESEGTWLSHGTDCASRLISVPTGQMDATSVADEAMSLDEVLRQEEEK